MAKHVGILKSNIAKHDEIPKYNTAKHEEITKSHTMYCKTIKSLNIV